MSRLNLSGLRVDGPGHRQAEAHVVLRVADRQQRVGVLDGVDPRVARPLLVRRRRRGRFGVGDLDLGDLARLQQQVERDGRAQRQDQQDHRQQVQRRKPLAAARVGAR